MHPKMCTYVKTGMHTYVHDSMYMQMHVSTVIYVYRKYMGMHACAYGLFMPVINTGHLMLASSQLRRSPCKTHSKDGFDWCSANKRNPKSQ